MAPPLYNDSKYRCCCCCHVERCAWVIAFIGAALCLLSAIASFITHQWAQGVLAIINFFVYFSILWAQHKRKAALYLPFLIINGISLVLSVVGLTLLIVIFFWLPGFFTVPLRDQWHKDYPDKPDNEGDLVTGVRIFIGLWIFAVFISTVIGAAFYNVVYRAYRYMKETE
ncbi:hypothetical protein Ddc_15285 [Ditylenchus destructor]|nr:hypothetical protein Ddc_15285 [Ditylenchus destructor]